MEGKLAVATSKQTLLEKNVSNITDVCKLLVSTACKSYGIKLNVPLPSDNNLLTDLVKSLASEIPFQQPIPVPLAMNSASIIEIEDDTAFSCNANNHPLQTVFSQVSELLGHVTAISSELESVKTDLTECQRIANENAQYPRLWNLLIYGLKIPEKTYMVELLESEQSNLLFPNLMERKITCEDICRSHPLKTKKPQTRPIVVVQFCNRDIRNLIYSKKKELKTRANHISISEHLTDETRSLLTLVRDAEVFERVWTFEAKIFGATGSEKILIRTKEDIPAWPKIQKRENPQHNKRAAQEMQNDSAYVPPRPTQTQHQGYRYEPSGPQAFSVHQPSYPGPRWPADRTMYAPSYGYNEYENNAWQVNNNTSYNNTSYNNGRGRKVPPRGRYPNQGRGNPR